VALSDTERLKTLPSTRRRAVDAPTNKHWSDSQKIEAVTTYLALGNMTLTASVLKIPEVTLRSWKAKTWWKEIEEDLKVQEDLQLSVRLQRIIGSTLEATEDRIKNGDWVYNNKEGKLERKPVSLRDVHRVGMDMMDKRDQLAGKTSTSVPLEAIEQKLLKLAEKFAALAQPKQIIEVTDVILGSIEEVPDGE